MAQQLLSGVLLQPLALAHLLPWGHEQNEITSVQRVAMQGCSTTSSSCSSSCLTSTEGQPLVGEKAQERDALLLAYRGCDDRGSALLCAGLVFHTAILSQRAGETIAHWCLTCVFTRDRSGEAEETTAEASHG